MSEEDFYEILGCPEEASHEDIKRAYHEQVLRFHPDKNKDSKQSAEKFYRIQKAWETLSDLKSKKLYDAERAQAKFEEESIIFFARVISDELYPKDEHLAYLCRCGSEYIVEKNDLENNEHLYVPCEECTFYIHIKVKKNTSDYSSDIS